MKLRLPHAPYIANKIAIDLSNCGFVTIEGGLEAVSKEAQILLEEDIRQEMALEEKVNLILDDNEDEIEFMRLDTKQLFWMAKKKLADEHGVILNWDDRYNNLAHKILDVLIGNDIIDFTVTENRVKNIIFKGIEGYIKNFESIEDDVLEKIDHYKRKLTPGTEEYDIVFQKLYEEELRKRGLA